MKKLLKNPIFTFILGLIMATTISVGATVLYNSSEIGFVPTNNNWNVNNVQDAINDLYNTDLMGRIDWSLNEAYSLRNSSTPAGNMVVDNLSGNYILAYAYSYSYGSEADIDIYGETEVDPVNYTFEVENGTCELLNNKTAQKTAITNYSYTWRMLNILTLKLYKCSFTNNGSVKASFIENVNTYNARNYMFRTIKID